jgi:hypothetical protein
MLGENRPVRKVIARRAMARLNCHAKKEQSASAAIL